MLIFLWISKALKVTLSFFERSGPVKIKLTSRLRYSFVRNVVEGSAESDSAFTIVAGMFSLLIPAMIFVRGSFFDSDSFEVISYFLLLTLSWAWSYRRVRRLLRLNREQVFSDQTLTRAIDSLAFPLLITCMLLAAMFGQLRLIHLRNALPLDFGDPCPACVPISSFARGFLLYEVNKETYVYLPAHVAGLTVPLTEIENTKE